MELLLSLLLFFIISINSSTASTTPNTLQPDCGYCSKPHPHPHPHPTLPPLVKPPVTVPKVPAVPKLPVPPVTVPKVPVLPPVNPSPTGGPTCPIDTLKLGACLDLLGGLVHIGLGAPAANKCCPIIAGLVEVEAAACLCTTLKIKALNLKIYVPIALQLLLTCGKTPPPGYTCSL